MKPLRNSLSISIVISLLLFSVLSLTFTPQATAQDKKLDKKKAENKKNAEKLTAEQLAEYVIFAYGGRSGLAQVRTNGIEEGIIKLATDDKEIEGRITRRFLRRDEGLQDLTRVDVKLPTQEITFGYNGFTVWAARDGVGFSPTKEIENSFLASVIHNYDALLRYKELGATLEKIGSDSIVGIDTEILELTHKDGSKTRFFISSKSYHILHLEYEAQLEGDKPTKFRESFYDFRAIQNTLVPTKVLLYENDKMIQEIRITQAKYHNNFVEETFLKY